MKHQTFIYYLHPFEQNEILRSVDRASRYNRAKKNQLDAQLLLSIRLPVVQDNTQSSKKNNKYQLLYTYGYAS